MFVGLELERRWMLPIMAVGCGTLDNDPDRQGKRTMWIEYLNYKYKVYEQYTTSSATLRKRLKGAC
jgi:hypothetical protein